MGISTGPEPTWALIAHEHLVGTPDGGAITRPCVDLACPMGLRCSRCGHGRFFRIIGFGYTSTLDHFLEPCPCGTCSRFVRAKKR